MKKKILIINKTQFGYLTDSVKWCEYLRKNYDVSLVCLDEKKEKIKIEGIKIQYVPFVLFCHIGAVLYLINCLFRILFFDGIIFVVFFHGCGILKKFFSGKQMILDIRTLSVSESYFERKKMNNEIKQCALIYDKVSVVSEGVKNILELNKAFILPLGSDVISTKLKSFGDTIDLLYVGTLLNRKIEKTLYGLRNFIDFNQAIKIHYDIIGDGPNGELEKLVEISRNLGLDKYVTFHGRLPHCELNSFFDVCNVGVSFVPITDYYQYQPPTKTFEYVLSGLYCIATDTFSNREVINDQCGILIKDSSDAFCEGLNTIIKRRDKISSVKISAQLQYYRWSNILEKYLLPVIG